MTRALPGRFIVLEGIDGAGTTTQRERLAEWLRGRGHGVHTTNEPTANPIGKLIREWLRPEARPLDPEAMALLFAADRRDHIAHEILPRLAAGDIVISDRYVLSSLAYQTSAGVPRELVRGANFGGSGVRTPDLTILVAVPTEIAAQRRARRMGATEIYDDLAMQERVARAYRDEAEAQRQAGAPVEIIDGSGSVDEVEAALREVITRRVLSGMPR